MSHRKEILTKVIVSVNHKKTLLFVIFILGLSGSFGFGIIIGAHLIDRPPMVIDKQLLITPSSSTTLPDSYRFMASRRGKYYYPIKCSLAQQLSPKNRIYFLTKEEAEAKGYQLNQKCQQ